MLLRCRDDSDIKEPRRASPGPVYLGSSNRSTPNLLTEHHSLPQHSSASNAFRSHLHHLLPRHAYFRARVQIHKVCNIPLVSGTFSARWKFKNVHSAPGAKHKLFEMVKGRSRPGTPSTRVEFDKAKSKEDSIESDDSMPSPSRMDDAVPSVVVSSFGRPQTSQNVSSGRTEDDARFRRLFSPESTPRTAVAPYDVKSAGLSPAGANRPNPLNLDFVSPIQSLFSPPSQSPNPMFSPGFNIPTVRIRAPKLNPMLTAKPDQRDPTSAARGQTPSAELKDHAVVWNHSVNTVLRIDVSRDSGILAISPLKLMIIQHSAKNDTSAPQKSRLGVMYLNMSEYVGKGAVERKYLLRESKSNAILKLTIELEYIGGDADYVAPPLPRGEVMNGITSLLEKDLYRAGLDRSSHPEKGVIPASRHTSQSSGSAIDQAPGGDLPTDSRLPLGVAGVPGAKNTEALIDALFNPSRTTDKEKESPFTVYVSPEELESAPVLDANPNQNLEGGSMYSTSSSNDDTWTSARTVSSHSSVSRSDTLSSKSSKIRKLHLPLGPVQVKEVEESSGGSRNVKAWWKRHIASRPSTPTFA